MLIIAVVIVDVSSSSSSVSGSKVGWSVVSGMPDIKIPQVLSRSPYQVSHCAALRPPFYLKPLRFPFLGCHLLSSPPVHLSARLLLACFLSSLYRYRYFISFTVFLGEYFDVRAEKQVTRISYLAIFFRRLLALSSQAPLMKSRTYYAHAATCTMYSWVIRVNIKSQHTVKPPWWNYLVTRKLENVVGRNWRYYWVVNKYSRVFYYILENG